MCSGVLFFCCLLFVSILSLSAGQEKQLLAVAVVFRHGDRTPITPYPNDPYRNASYWPVGWGQLTNIGKEQHYQLGKWFRNRYSNFLSSEYSEKDIRVRSTDVDRALMSAEANLAGLYPPSANQVWDKSVAWQPIPIHTMPEIEDATLAMKKPCRRYDLLLKQLKRSEEFVEINRKLHDLYAYLTKYSGTVVTSIVDVEYLYNNLFIESLYNLTLPDWTKPVFPDKMKPWAQLSFAISTYTPDLARLKVGPFFYDLQQFFSNRSANNFKFRMFSGHDVTISNLLNSIGAFEYHSPPYTSTIMFELVSIDNSPFVNVYYKNTSEPQKIVVKGCDFDCPLDKFISVLEPLTLSLPEWENACTINLFSAAVMSDLRIVYIFTVIACVSLLSLMTAIFVMHRRRKRKNVYFRLPDDVVDT